MTGTQSIRRSFAIVRHLAGASQEGEKLVDIANAMELPHPTAHRILKALEDEGIVERAEGTQRYRLAAETAWLGVAPFNRCPITRYASPHLDELVAQTGSSVLLSVPSHIDSVYADRRIGNLPSLLSQAEIGSRRPLGAGTGGRVMLAHMSPERLDSVLEQNAARYAQYRAGPETVRRDVAEARAQGFLVGNSPLSREGRVVAVAVRDVTGRAIGAISLVGPRSQGFERRIEGLLPQMRGAAREIAARIQQQRVTMRCQMPIPPRAAAG
ncbi:IclR family transcriptional regulator [Mangrovicoccus sp. HB161399]|uniref:IclR family transcriptional regulator n=1 Tax=Mangrovicoccus sp. HB161399 TaxID=2720392 RepID=UPI0015520766|nr:IclR family transcriptional regulator [Mangrovicoccus sp. HB161399]